MYNALISLSLGAATYALLAASRWLTPYESSLPAALLAVVALVLLARRTFRSLEATLRDSGALLQQRPPKIGQAMAQMRKGYALTRWQFGVRSQVDAQLGMLLFLTQDLRGAQPLLKRAYLLSPWLAGAMLAVIQYKLKDPTGMRKTMTVVTRKAKKQGLAWNLYAYMLDDLGDRDEAVRVLSEGQKSAGHDPRVKESLLALQNGRKMKMRGYNEQWYQFQLERPPAVRQAAHARPSRGFRQAQQRGRW